MDIDLSDLAAVERFLHERLRQPLPGPEVHLRFAPRPAVEKDRVVRNQELHRPEPHAASSGQASTRRPAEDVPSRARRAAALILIYPGERGATIPLTVRHTDLPHHPGQVSLPGGRIDLDESAEQAALRETHEEIGVTPDAVRTIGPLSPLWVGVSNHLIQPFVGIADRAPAFQLAAREVEALVEFPLVELHDLTRMGREQRTRDGVLVDIPFFSLHGHRVWGATAMILGEFGALFDADFGPGGVLRF